MIQCSFKMLKVSNIGSCFLGIQDVRKSRQVGNKENETFEEEAGKEK